MTNALDLVTVYIQQATPITNLVNSVSATVRQFYELRDGDEAYVQLGSRFYQRDSILSFWIEGEYPERPLRDYPEWKQPTDVLECFNVGDRVLHNGEVWESAIDSNDTEPTRATLNWICLAEDGPTYAITISRTGYDESQSHEATGVTNMELIQFYNDLRKQRRFVHIKGDTLNVDTIRRIEVAFETTEEGTGSETTE